MGSLSLLLAVHGAVICLGAMMVLGAAENGPEHATDDTSLPGGRTCDDIASTWLVPSDRPWQMALFYGGRFRCGMTLVGESWGITAAHCVAGSNPLGMSVAPVNSLIQGGLPSRRFRRYVRQVFLHPRYFNNVLGGGAANFDNDVALLLLTCPSSPHVGQGSSPLNVCHLSPRNSDIFPGSLFLFPSRQRLEDSGDDETFDAVSADVISLDECRQRWNTSVSPRMLCGRIPRDGVVCRGDSGIPLVSFGETGTCHLEGVVSSGHADCHGDGDVFLLTRMSSFGPWINSVKGRYPRLCRRQ